MPTACRFERVCRMYSISQEAEHDLWYKNPSFPYLAASFFAYVGCFKRNASVSYSGKKGRRVGGLGGLLLVSGPVGARSCRLWQRDHYPLLDGFHRDFLLRRDWQPIR